MKKGKSVGVSVGPGDKAQITFEALETIKNADIVFLPTSPKEDCTAYKIIKKIYPQIDEKELRCETFTMSRSAELLKQRHQEIFEVAKAELDNGNSIVFLALGEVTLFSTYVYIHEMLLEEGYESSFVPGISSVQAAAGRLSVPLASGSENLHIFGEADNLEEKLRLSGTKVFMKNRKGLETLISEIKKCVSKNPDMKACGVSNCGMEGEILAFNVDELDSLTGYFTVIFVKGSPAEKNDFSYFENHDCKYYPCHDSEHINCLFCYCPMYSLEKCPGKPEYIEREGKRIKNCTNCTFPHEKENYDRVIKVLKISNKW